ncbi:MAG: response regulator [Opitutae bacterium]|nr:response regulator [Opitutae bacterium]
MKILIIDDDPVIRQVLQVLLESNGYTVRIATDGIEGVQLAADAPDLILCDIGLPRLDGYSVITAIQRLPQCRDVPFIFLTGRAERNEQRRGMTLGADDYITKPFTEKEILEAIEARVRRQRPLRERIERLVNERRHEISAEWAHELLTPLSGVLGGLQLIEEEGDHVSVAELKHLLGVIRSSAERQLRLARKLIRFYDLERIKERGMLPATALCRADLAVASAAARAGAEEKRPNDLRVQCESGDVVVTDTLLIDAVAELVENALRFSSPGQLVFVTGRGAGPMYRIEILDAGPGLTSAQRASVGAFTQFDRNRLEQQGLGLGLAIASATASIANGQLRLEDGPQGRGLKAVLELPMPCPGPEQNAGR